MNIKKCIFPILVFLFICISGCTSSTNTTKKEHANTVETTETPSPKVVKNNDMIEKKFISLHKIKSIDKMQFDYNKKHQLVNGEKLSRVEYGKDGLATQTTIYDSHGQIQYVYKYKYDKEGKRIETIRYDKNAKADKKYTYEYNEYGNKIRSDRYNMDNILEKYYLYKYDDEENLIEDLWYDKDGNLEYRIKNEYEDGKKTTSFSYNSDNNMIYKYDYHYDKNGDIIEEIRYNADGKELGIIQYVYVHY